MMKLLIIDDNVDALEVAKTRLAKENLNVLCADGGIPGLEMARGEKPDVILLDLDMPDMCGFDVCRALKADAELCMIPILFLSASSTAEDKVKGLDLGAIDYVTKPFDAFELRARVRAALRTKHLQDLLIEHAHIDPLTGLPNRRALMERLRSEWARIERHGGQLSFLLADVDHFKQINDTYGHHIGDEILKEVARAIARQCRVSDLPARYGGDEFAIVAPCASAAGGGQAGRTLPGRGREGLHRRQRRVGSDDGQFRRGRRHGPPFLGGLGPTCGRSAVPREERRTQRGRHRQRRHAGHLHARRTSVGGHDRDALRRESRRLPARKARNGRSAPSPPAQKSLPAPRGERGVLWSSQRWTLHDALRNHRIGDLDEAGDVRAADIVDVRVGLAVLHAVLMNRLHDLAEAAVNFLLRPVHDAGVLAHFQSGNRHARPHWRLLPGP